MKKLLSLFMAGAVFTAFAPQSGTAQIIDPVISVTGSVMNELTREPISVNVIILDKDGKRVGNSRSNARENGYYLVTGLKGGQTYTVRLEQPNYFQTQYAITLPKTNKYTEISRDFLVLPMTTGIRIPLEISPFEAKKSSLRVGSEEILNQLQSLLTSNPNVRIEIQSYPDADMGREENLRLTQERTKTLRDYLVSRGLAANRVTVTPSAEIDPINPPPLKRAAKGKRYIGTTYVVVTSA